MDFFDDIRMSEQAFAFFRKAYELHMSGELQPAIVLYKRSLEAQPTAEAHTFLGWAYSFTGNLEEAMAECQRAIAIDPDFGNPYNDIGAYLIQQGKLDEAIPWLQKATAAPRYANPEYPHTNLGRIYEMKALWPLALEEYEKALAIQPGDIRLQSICERLRALLN